MCRIYLKHGQQYIRCCYRCGDLRGQHIPFTGEPPLSPGGHYNGGRSPRQPQVRAETVLCFAVSAHCARASVEDMARYANAAFIMAGELVVLYRLAGQRRWRNTSGIVARAASFGWRRVALPPELAAQVHAGQGPLAAGGKHGT